MQVLDFGRNGVVWRIGDRMVAEVRPISRLGGWVARALDGSTPFVVEAPGTGAHGQTSAGQRFAQRAEAVQAVERFLDAPEQDEDMAMGMA